MWNPSGRIAPASGRPPPRPRWYRSHHPAPKKYRGYHRREVPRNRRSPSHRQYLRNRRTRSRLRLSSRRPSPRRLLSSACHLSPTHHPWPSCLLCLVCLPSPRHLPNLRRPPSPMRHPWPSCLLCLVGLQCLLYPLLLTPHPYSMYFQCSTYLPCPARLRLGPRSKRRHRIPRAGRNRRVSPRSRNLPWQTVRTSWLSSYFAGWSVSYYRTGKPTGPVPERCGIRARRLRHCPSS